MSQGSNSIDQLPCELLCMVFNYLELQSVKNAACTCRRWNEIIFASPYMDRFIFTVFIKDLTDKRKIVLKQLVETVTKSKRSYRNLSWRIDEFMYSNFQSVWQAIHPKFTKNLVLFKVTFEDTSLLLGYASLAEDIPLMPKLKELQLLEQSEEIYDQDYTLMFRSETVETLTLDFDYTSSIEMPQLRSYAGPLSAIHHQPTGTNAESHKLERMKHLTVTQKGSTSIDPSVFLRIPNLETIIWDSRLGHDIFIAMCETCTSLKELCFRKVLYIQNIAALDHLSMLKHLYRLEFYDIQLDDGLGFSRHGLSFDFVKVVNLTQLDLGILHPSDSTLLHLPSRITKIGLRLQNADEGRKIEKFITLPLLTELRFGYKNQRAALSPETLKSLSLLKNLEVLEFYRCIFTQPAFLAMDAPLDRVHTLRFRQCQLETKNLFGLQQKFPILAEPEIQDCIMNIDPALIGYDIPTPFRGFLSV